MQSELVNATLRRYNPEIVAAAKEAALAALRAREVKDNEIAAQKGAKRVFLEVRVSNSPAFLLYLKHGFNGLYARSRYYADGEDAIVMMKELD